MCFTSFNYKRAIQYSGVPTTGSLYREKEENHYVIYTSKKLVRDSENESQMAK